MISFTVSGSYKKTEKFLRDMDAAKYADGLDALAREGVQALMANTPKETGLTATSWDYTIEKKRGRVTITWTNSHVVSGIPVIVLIQYGHATGTGGYVQGIDVVNPALKPTFDKLATKVWQEVTK